MDDLKCKICSSETKSFFIKTIKKNYHKCIVCGFIFMNKEDLLEKKDEKNIYEKHENKIENEGYVNMFKKFINYGVDPFKINIKTILEFGSGPGPVLAELLKKEGFQVDIYDPYYSPEKIYEGKSYDMISSTEVFEHFYNPDKTIKIISKHIKKGGILAIMTTFLSEKEDFEKWWYKNDPSHVSFYSLKTFEFISKIFDFNIIKHNNKNIIILEKR